MHSSAARSHPRDRVFRQQQLPRFPSSQSARSALAPSLSRSSTRTSTSAKEGSIRVSRRLPLRSFGKSSLPLLHLPPTRPTFGARFARASSPSQRSTNTLTLALARHLRRLRLLFGLLKLFRRPYLLRHHRFLTHFLPSRLPPLPWLHLPPHLPPPRPPLPLPHFPSGRQMSLSRLHLRLQPPRPPPLLPHILSSRPLVKSRLHLHPPRPPQLHPRPRPHPRRRPRPPPSRSSWQRGRRLSRHSDGSSSSRIILRHFRLSIASSGSTVPSTPLLYPACRLALMCLLKTLRLPGPFLNRL